MSQKARRSANELHRTDPLQLKPVSDGVGEVVVVVRVIVVVVMVVVVVVFVEPDIATESQLESLLDSLDVMEAQLAPVGAGNSPSVWVWVMPLLSIVEVFVVGRAEQAVIVWQCVDVVVVSVLRTFWICTYAVQSSASVSSLQPSSSPPLVHPLPVHTPH